MSDVNSATDQPRQSFIDWGLPASIRPYARLARLDRPIGTWLLLFPCWWGYAMAGDGLPDLWALFLFAAGALVMRGAGCTLNDIVDRNFDARVARTRTRPIPAGQVTIRQAVIFLGFQLLIGLAVVLNFNTTAIFVAIGALPLVVIYPFMKRITWWPQAFLGLTFNWGALVGWAAASGQVAWSAGLLYLGGLFWTLGYDTFYAHQDKEDDQLIGVKSSALRLGTKTVPAISVFYVLALGLMVSAGMLAGAGPVFIGAALLLGGVQLIWQLIGVDINDPKNCLGRFKSNRWFGWALLIAILADQYLGA